MNGPAPGCWAVVADFLTHAGVGTVFGLPADDLVALRDLAAAGVQMIVCRDQRNAVHMATGYAQQAGSVGVCLVGKGPAVANAVTGLLEASSSRTPVLLLGPGTAPDRRDAGAFQDAAQLALVSPVVKRAFRVDDPARVAAVLQQAWTIATGNAPGPVYVEFGEQLAAARVPVPYRWHDAPETSAGYTLPAGCRAVDLLARSRRPVVLVGGGGRNAGAGRAVLDLAESIGAAVITTASGRGAVDEEHPLFLGLSGLYCRPPVARLLDVADLVISVGSRLEETSTMGWPPACLGPTVIQVNIDAGDFSTDRSGMLIQGDAAAVLRAWQLALHRRGGAMPEPQWLRAIARARDLLLQEAAATVWEQQRRPELHVAELLWTLNRLGDRDDVLVQENGLQDMWSYLFPYHVCGSEAAVVAPSEQTTLGFGAAAAAGVAAADPDRRVVALVGDGAFALFAADLPTLAENRLPVLYVVLVNGGYGWLQAESDARGIPEHRFADPGRRPPHVDVEGVHTVVLADKTRLADDLADALARTAAGQVVVLLAPVRLADAPPGIAEVLQTGSLDAIEPIPEPGHRAVPHHPAVDIGVMAGTYELARE